MSYTEQPSYPDVNSFIKDNGEFDNDAFNAVCKPWSEMQLARRTLLRDAGFEADRLDDSNRATVTEFLSGNNGANRVYSPLNVYMALSMLAETTDGETRQQILDLLGVDTIESLRTIANNLWNANYINDGAATSLLASSLWLNQNVNFITSTMDLPAYNYYAHPSGEKWAQTASIRRYRTGSMSKQAGFLRTRQYYDESEYHFGFSCHDILQGQLGQ